MMSLQPFVAVALRATLLLFVALVAAGLLRQGSASLRRWLLLLGALAALAVPPLSWAVTGREVMHVAAPRVVVHVVAEALSSSTAPPREAGYVGPLAEGRPSRTSWQAVLLAIWAAGALGVLLRVFLGLLAARRLARRAHSTEMNVRSSSDIEGPAVVGVFSPVILLPLAAEGWSAERRRAVLLHEAAHVRRRDGLTLLAAQLACALYWFQPLAWLLLGRLRRECELAADEDVLAAGFRATHYAEHLLAIARDMSVPVGGVAMAGRPSELSRRIRVLVSRTALPPPLSRVRAAACSVFAVAVLTLVACTGSAALPVESPSKAQTFTTDAALQNIAVDEAQRARSDAGAQRVAIVVLDAHSGRVLATTDDRPGAPIVPASTLKPLTVALALDAGAIDAGQRFDCGNGQRAYGDQTLRDAGEYGLLDSAQILAVSSNVGVSRIFDALGGERLGDGLRRFHIEAPSEIPSASLRGAIIAMGEGSTTTPVALASAYTVFANDGVYAAPGLAQAERVLKVETARSLRAMLEGVVTGEQATGKAARVSGVRVGGKTGTSDDPDCQACAQGPGLFASFIGIVPIDRPRYVIYVGVGQPTEPGSGGTLAAPVFSRLATRILAASG
jgi:beta-lactamase regulating signal transducer with metallopeptidase domain